MVWYVALVAILNVALGYAVAVYLGAGRKREGLRQVVHDSEPYESFDASDDYESRNAYAESIEENDAESLAVG